MGIETLVRLSVQYELWLQNASIQIHSLVMDASHMLLSQPRGSPETEENEKDITNKNNNPKRQLHCLSNLLVLLFSLLLYAHLSAKGIQRNATQ